jgi:hypothetical protein
MISYSINCKIDLEALDSYLKRNYPVEILTSAENYLKLKIFGFYRFMPFEFFILNEAIVSIEHMEKFGSTKVSFSLFASFFISYLFFSVIAAIVAATSCGPENFGDFFLFCLFFFLLFFLPGYLWARFKHQRLISILTNGI